MEQVATIFWQILPILISIAIPSVLVLAKWLASKLASKLDAEGKVKVQELLNGIIMGGVAYAEQIAKQKAQNNQAVNGGTKLYIATQWIIDELNKQKIVELTAEEIQKRIESVLGMDTLTTNATTNALFRDGGMSDEDGSIGFNG